MLLEVRLFGGLTERVGSARTRISLADDATVGDLRRAVAAQHPSVAGLLGSVKVAVDLEVVSDDLTLSEDSEVALLPPVAGGAGSGRGAGDDGDARSDGAGRASPDVRIVTGLRQPPFDVDAVAAEVTAPDVGGTAVFLGTVRDHSAALDGVTRLDYSAYPEMADKVLAALATDLVADHPHLRGIALLHAVGELPVGAHTVLIVCASAHRAEAFAACQDALERVKDQVPVWKREVTGSGQHRWVGLEEPPTPA